MYEFSFAFCVEDYWNIFAQRMYGVISHPLSFIFDASFRAGVLPTCWRDALVTPVFKKGATSSPSNYSPISLTYVCCRVMERIINTSILDYLYMNKLVNAVQHGFLRKHSTCTNLLESVHDWSAGLNDKHSANVVHIDFQKAFDTVSHPKLVLKLESYRISGHLLAWPKAFLFDRTQAVEILHCISDKVQVTSGVPQGSVLGSTLFLSHASAVAQGNVVRAMSASYGKSLYSTLRRNQTP
jgi:hypothetical protein